MLLEILILIYLFIIVFPNFLSYKYLLKKKYLRYAWSGHAAILGISTMLLILSKNSFPIIPVLASTTLIVTGFGLVLILISFWIENKRSFDKSPLFTLAMIISHFIMGLIGIYFISVTEISLNELLISWLLLFAYYLFMFNKIDIKWIIYEPSKITKKVSKLFVRISIAIVYFLIPVIIYLS